MIAFTTPTSTVDKVFGITSAQLVPLLGIIVLAIGLPIVFYVIDTLILSALGRAPEAHGEAIDTMHDSGEN